MTKTVYPHSGRRATLRTVPPLTHCTKNIKSVMELSTSLFLLQHQPLDRPEWEAEVRVAAE